MIRETLKELRNNKGISQREFAQMLGISQQTVGSWEVGRTEPDNTMLKQIAKYFNVSIDYLLDNDGGTGTPPLNAEQAELIAEYDALNDDLNDEGRGLIRGMIGSLRLTHGKSGRSTALPNFTPAVAPKMRARTSAQ